MAGHFRGLLVFVAAIPLALVTLAGCGSASQRSPAADSPRKAGAPSATSSTGSETAPMCGGGQWHAVALAVSHSIAVPPVPTIMAVRTAQHPACGYDRVVFDITGQIPSYAIRYSSQVIADASGSTIALPGQRYLIVTLRPAQAHTDAGVATITRAVQVPGMSAVMSWVLAGDVEGVVQLAIGLPGQASFRARELPGRLYIDIKE